MRSVGIFIGHSGPRTGTWWEDREGLLDEWELANRLAICAAYECLARGWQVFVASASYKGKHSLLEKVKLARAVKPDVIVSCHFGANEADGDRDPLKYAGVDAPCFRRGNIPFEGDWGTGVNVVYPTFVPEAKTLAGLLAMQAVEALSSTLANDNGLDPRPMESVPGRNSIYIFNALKPTPVVIYEPGALTSGQDRKLIRESAFYFNQAGKAVGEALDRWWMQREETDE